MRIGKAISATWRTLKLTRKSDREEFFLYLKLVLIGFGIAGGIGFIVYYVAAILELAAGVTNANPAGANPAILFNFLKGVL